MGQLDLEAEGRRRVIRRVRGSRRIGTNKGGSDGAVTGGAMSRRLQA